MPPQLPPPPLRPSLFDIERSSSPPACEDDTPVACEGLELTVYGLNHSTPHSATDHLRQILQTLKQNPGRNARRDALYDAVVVRAADVKNCFDYAYVSLSRERVPQPRADLLQDLRKTLLDSDPTLRVLWRTQSGPDRTRRVFFTFDSKELAVKAKPALDNWMNVKKYAFYTAYISKPFGPWRITYDFYDLAHVTAIMAGPPPIAAEGEHTPHRPRFITPSYGYQVALLNCRDWSSAQDILDGWVRRLFRDDPTDPVIYSAMELDGDVYTVVLPSWAHAITIVDSYNHLESYLEENPVTRHIVRTPQPGLLYCLNGIGLAISRPGSSDSSSTPSREFAQLRREFENTRDQGAELLKTVFRISTQNTDAITHLSEQMDVVRANSTALAVSQSLSNQLLDVNMSLTESRRGQEQAELVLLQPDLPENVANYHVQCARRRQHEVQEYAAEKKRLQAEIAAIHHAISASLPAPIAAPVAPRPVHLPAASTATPGPSDPGIPPPYTRRSSTASVEEAMEEVRSSRSSSHLCTPERPLSCLSKPEKDVPCRPPRVPPPQKCSSPSSPILPRLCSSFLILFYLCIVITSFAPSFPLAAASSPSLSALTINCNGLANTVKQAAVADMIHRHSPHVWVATETKSTSLLQDRVRAPQYTKFESVGRSLDHGRGGKWGLIVGVRRTLHAQLVPVDSVLQGRVLALDVIVPTTDGHGFSHRIVAVYAPWDPGVPAVINDFWSHISSLCSSAPHSWMIIGDCNVTLTPAESSVNANPSRVKQQAYLSCLSAADGYDVWQTQHDADARTSYTCKSNNDQGRTVIDRVAVSRRGTFTASCSVPVDFIPATDHRPVLAHISLSVPRHLANRTPIFDPFPTPSYPPRFRYPKRADAYRFSDFANRVDAAVREEHLADYPVTDDASFTLRYSALTRIFRSCGTDSFELPRTPPPSPSPRPTTPRIRQILQEIRHANQLIASLRQGYFLAFLARHEWAVQYLSAFHTQPQAPPAWHHEHNPAFQSYLISLRKSLQRLRFRAERPEDIKRQTVRYFTDLFRRAPRAPSAKPWVSSPSVQQIRDRTAEHPFSWPQPLTLPDFRFLLRKGNPRPAPGPDQWEKWCIKSLSDSALTLVLDLVNYEVTRSHFPDCVKPAIMSTIFKRGPRTDLANYRGITCSNLVKNIPFAWLNHLMSRYLTMHNILPDTQIATQPGVQARDLTSFLSQVEAFAHRQKRPLYLLRRDQRKGFDRLEPEGFYDAVRAYGLPPSLIDLDRSAQHAVPYQVKTVHGLTEPFTVSGVTQQGGPFSPMKSTLTTSLANHWLRDVLTPDQHVNFQSHHGSRGMPHTPDDRLTLRTQFVEAMDDSVIIAPTLPASQAAGLHVERFQAAYGWETNWQKSLLAVLHAGPVPLTLPMPSVEPNDPDSGHLIYHSIAVTASHCEFLRVQINDPQTQYQKIRAIITNFSFPVMHTRLPFTAVRRIISQCLISRIRPYLSYQPVTRAQATDLDHLLAATVHHYFKFPFRFNSSLLFLPITHFGFDFPSIVQLNDIAAISGLVRDLNHHVSTFRTMARITLADWTCLLNHCESPLERPTTRHFARSMQVLPAAWVIALNALQHLQLSVRSSDQSHLYSGDVSLRHLHHLFPHHPLLPSSLAITNLERAHLSHLSHLASWNVSATTQSYTLKPHPHVTHALSTFSARHDWPAVQCWLRALSLADITNAAAGLFDSDIAPTARSSDDRWTLALPPSLRQDYAETAILAAVRLSSSSSPSPERLPEDILASDASAVHHPRPHVTFAATSPRATLTLAIAPTDRSASSLHGEVFGLVLAALLHLHYPALQPPSRPVLYTDHLNSVRFYQTLSSPSPSPSPPQNPALPLYYWLLNICERSPNAPLITYTPAHTSDSSPPAQANRLVDRLASTAHTPGRTPFTLPLPTFTLPSFVLHAPSHGYILPPSIPTAVRDVHVRSLLSDPSSRPNSVLFRSLYDQHPPPSHPYIRASSAYSALVQLYSRSSQLDDAFTRFRRFHDASPLCHFGCDTLETPHHLFVQCPHFAEVRDEHKMCNVRRPRCLKQRNPLPKEVIQRAAASLFVDDPDIWPQTSTRYFLGMIPPIPGIPESSSGAHLHTTRLLSRIATSWHSTSIRLTARIWGSYKRATNPFSPRIPSPITLPPHLAHLL
uniref:Trihydroxynaphthalene reductase ) n=1 Tax=Ganoderma boninense TaxID=34458 RepID=A0A5K1K845_9APHY|nr:Trihydroxynaphthalene reductase (EC (T3HN reductase) [Ganoderma boninense]